MYVCLCVRYSGHLEHTCEMYSPLDVIAYPHPPPPPARAPIPTSHPPQAPVGVRYASEPISSMSWQPAGLKPRPLSASCAAAVHAEACNVGAATTSPTAVGEVTDNTDGGGGGGGGVIAQGTRFLCSCALCGETARGTAWLRVGGGGGGHCLGCKNGHLRTRRILPRRHPQRTFRI